MPLAAPKTEATGWVPTPALACGGATPGDPGYPCRSRPDDIDGDGFSDSTDTAPTLWNPSQNFVGPDSDGDGIAEAEDNCPLTANADQLDLDGDGQGNVCDADADGDFLPDEFETGTGVFADETDTGTDPENPDSDGDGILDGAEVIVGMDPNVADPPAVPLLGPVAIGTLALLVAAGGFGRLRRRH